MTTWDEKLLELLEIMWTGSNLMEVTTSITIPNRKYSLGKFPGVATEYNDYFFIII
jgi:hypothetical protein